MFKQMESVPRMNKVLTCTILGLTALLYAGCDQLDPDVVPDDQVVERAEDVDMTITPGAPVVVNLLQSVNLTGNAVISITRAPQHGTLEFLKSALLKYTPDEDFTSGSDEAHYSVCAGSDCDEARIEFTFATGDGTCTAHALADEASLTSAEASVTIDVLSNDEACDQPFATASLAIAEAPEAGQATIQDGAITYVPAEGYDDGDVEFVYSVTTAADAETLYYGVVTIHLSAITLVAEDDDFTYTFEEYDAALSGGGLFLLIDDVLGNDNLNGAAYNKLESVSLTSTGSYGNMVYYSLEGFKYTPGESFSGTDACTYEVCDEGVCTEATIQITVSDYGNVVAQADTYSYTAATWEGTLTNFDGIPVLALTYDELADNDVLGNLTPTVSIYAQPSQGTVFYDEGEAIFRYAATDGYAFLGTDSFTYQICYDQTCSQATVTITVDID